MIGKLGSMFSEKITTMTKASKDFDEKVNGYFEYKHSPPTYAQITHGTGVNNFDWTAKSFTELIDDAGTIEELTFTLPKKSIYIKNKVMHKT